MSQRVVDASVAAKWFLPETYSSEALLLRSTTDELIAPDILAVEIARIVLKKVRRREMPETAARATIAACVGSFVVLHSTQGFLDVAIDIGLRHQRDPFDGLYVALALQERCTLVTADRILYDALAPIYPETMVWVGDLPMMLGT